MAKLDVVNWNSKSVGEVSSEIFDAKVRKDILHTMVRWHLAEKRQGTHKAKTRGEVRGTGKKPFKQKGTGSARQGSFQSPLLTGGGVTFAPRPRNYSFDVPKKVKRLGLKSALSYLFQENKISVVEDMKSDAGKTAELVKRLENFGVNKALLVSDEVDSLFKRASGNIKKIKYMPVAGVNVYDLLKYDRLILTKASLAGIEARVNGV